MQAGNKVEELSDIPTSLDSSLEEVFGQGATKLVKKLENNSDKKEELKVSDTEHDSDSEVEHLKGSTPSKDQRKKRVREKIKGIKDNRGVSSEGENSGEATKELKKPRLGGENIGIHEKDDIQALEKEEENHSEKLAEEVVEDKDHTEGLEEQDKIFKALLDMHEEVPLEDPGPNHAGEDMEEGVGGATQ